MTRWRAILEGEDAARARARVDVILRDVRRLLDAGASRAALDDPWLPLLFAYAWAADRSSEELEAYTVDRLAIVNRRLEAPLSSAALWGGLAGLAWLNAHVERVFIDESAESGGEGGAGADASAGGSAEADAGGSAEADAGGDASAGGSAEGDAGGDASAGGSAEGDADADADAEEAGPALDRALAQLVRDGAPAHYDLVSGVVGVGVVGLERSTTETGAELIDAVCEELARRAAPEPAAPASEPLPGAPARTLFTPAELLPSWQRAVAPAGYLNLGLAHGVPGAIGFLAHAIAAGRTAGGARALLSDLVAWTLAQRDRRIGGGGFTSWLLPGPRPAERQGTRTAWCYGGLGAGAALVLAGTLTDEPAWRAAGTDICLAEAAVALEASGIADAGLCHGAAGNAHIFNRLYQATGEERFREAALRYYRHALDDADDTRGIGGYVAQGQISDDDGADGGSDAGAPGAHRGARPRIGPVDDASFLTGTAGIGLALLAAVTDIEPQWDRVLLVDLPPRT